MERKDDAIKLFKEFYGKAPQEFGYKEIGIDEKRQIFIYAESKEVIRAFKTLQNITCWMQKWSVWVPVVAILNYLCAILAGHDTLHWQNLATYALLAVWLVSDVVLSFKAMKLDDIVKMHENVSYLKYE